MNPITILAEAGGVCALHQTTLGRHATLSLSRSGHRAAITLNRYELRALATMALDAAQQADAAAQRPTEAHR